MSYDKIDLEDWFEEEPSNVKTYIAFVFIALFLLALSGCAADHTNITKAGEGNFDVFLIQMCQDKKNQSLYQCKELCKEYVCR